MQTTLIVSTRHLSPPSQHDLERAISAVRSSRRGDATSMKSFDTPQVRALLLKHPGLVAKLLDSKSGVRARLRCSDSTASSDPSVYLAWVAEQDAAKARGAAYDERFEVEIDTASSDFAPLGEDDLLSSRDVLDDVRAQAARMEIVMERMQGRLEDAQRFAALYGDPDGARGAHINSLRSKIKELRLLLRDQRARIERLECVGVLTLMGALGLVAIEHALQDAMAPKFREQALSWLSSRSESPQSFQWWARHAGIRDFDNYQLNLLRSLRQALEQSKPAPAAQECVAIKDDLTDGAAVEPLTASESMPEPAPLDAPISCPAEDVAHEPTAPRRAGRRHGRVLLGRMCRSPPYAHTKERAPARRRTKNLLSNNDDVNQLFRLSALSLALVAGAAHADYESARQSLHAGHAMQEFKRLAASDDPRANDAACAVGAMHFDARAFDLAVPLLERAAAGGSAWCQFLLGRLFVTGTHVGKDEPRAFSLMKASADGGNLTAMVELGRYYFNGNGVAKDRQLALASMRRAAEGGLPEGQLAYGQAYYWGWGGKVDMSVAAAWAEKAAAQGHPTAQAFLAIMLYEGRGVPRNDARALDLFLRAAEKGVATAQYGAGMMFELGRGTAVDYKQAEHWYERAAAQGDREAEVALGLLAYNGRGRPANASVAFSHFLTAAQAGDAKGMQYVGYHLETGEGVERDLDAARGWYAKSAEKGNAVAQERLKALSK